MKRSLLLILSLASVVRIYGSQELHAGGNTATVVAMKESLRPSADVLARALPIPGRCKPGWEDHFLSGKFSIHELGLPEQGSLSVLFMDYGKELSQKLVNQEGNNALHLWLLLKIKQQKNKKSVSRDILRAFQKFAVFYTEKKLEAKNVDGKTPYDLFEAFHGRKHSTCTCSMLGCFERWFKKYGLLEWTQEEQTPDVFHKTSYGIVTSSLKDRCMGHRGYGQLEGELRRLRDEKQKTLVELRCLGEQAKLELKRNIEALPKTQQQEALSNNNEAFLTKKIAQITVELKEMRESLISRKQWFLKQQVVRAPHDGDDQPHSDDQQLITPQSPFTPRSQNVHDFFKPVV